MLGFFPSRRREGLGVGASAASFRGAVQEQSPAVARAPPPAPPRLREGEWLLLTDPKQATQVLLVPIIC